MLAGAMKRRGANLAKTYRGLSSSYLAGSYGA